MGFGLGGLIGGAVGGLLSGIGASKAQKRYNAAIGQMMSGTGIHDRASQMNPWLFGAMNAGQNQAAIPQSGYGHHMWQLANNPGQMDPSLMNMPFHLSAMRQNQDLARAQSLLGKSGGPGISGIGNAYVGANLAARTARDVGTAQNFAMWREQQKRADLGMIQNALNAALGQAAGAAGGQAQMYQQPLNAWQMGGNMIGAGMGAMAPFMGQGGQKPITQGWQLNQGNQQAMQNLNPMNFFQAGMF